MPLPRAMLVVPMSVVPPPLKAFAYRKPPPAWVRETRYVGVVVAAVPETGVDVAPNQAPLMPKAMKAGAGV